MVFISGVRLLMTSRHRRWRGKTPQSEPVTPGVKGDSETHGIHLFVFYIVSVTRVTRVVKVWRGETGQT